LLNLSKETMEYIAPTVLILFGIIFSFLFVIFIKRISKKQEERAKHFEKQVLSASWSKEESLRK
jgi:F0F1-type ATP synthase membrane subunit b/b'